MDKKDIQKIVKDIFVKPLKDKATNENSATAILARRRNLEPTTENVVVEKKTEPKKGNMRRGRKA